MGEAILTEAQHAAIAAVAREPQLAHCYLSGGTALAAYHLHHRQSDDLDFFTADDTDPAFLRAFMDRVRAELGAPNVRSERLYDRSLFFVPTGDSELKIEFTKYPFPQIEQPVGRDGIRVDGMRDIAANKIVTLLDRFEPKDFVDLYFLLDRISLADMRRDAEAKFSTTIQPLALGSALANVRRVEALPRMVLPLTIPELRSRCAEEAKKLSPDVVQ